MDWNARIRAAFDDASVRVPEADVIEELAQHARAMYEAARAEGCTHLEANDRVTEQITVWQRESAALLHKSTRLPTVEPPSPVSSSAFASTAQDVRYAARLLRRQPRFALLAILTMALGIAATTILFGVTYGTLMRPLPWPDAERLVVLKETRGGKAPRFLSFSNAAYLAWREQASTVEELGAWSQRVVTLADTGDPARIRITAATASLFRVLGTRPLIGSTFEKKDESSPVVILSESLWRERFSGDPTALGRSVRLDGQPHTIIGVVEDRLFYPDSQSRAWVPFRVVPATGNYLSMFNAVARLRPGATALQASDEGTARGHFAAQTGMTTMAIFGGDGAVEVTATPLREALTSDVHRPLIVLLVGVALLLLIATTNVASLQVARATTRRRELAIRSALGASSSRVARQLVIETLVLGLAGGAAGLALALILARGVPVILPLDFPRVGDFAVDGTVILFTLGISIVTSLLAALLPALRMRRLNLVESLAEDGIAPVGLSGRSGVTRTRLLIIGGQVAMACVLLVGALLLGRSFVALLNADRGFDPSKVLSARVSMPDGAYTPQRRQAIVGQVLERLLSVPDVRAVAFTSEFPLTPGGSTSALTLPSRTAVGGSVSVQASPRIVSADYFSALGLRLIAGRSLEHSDTETSQRVVVVNSTFAKRYLDDAPLGTKIPVAVWGQQDRRTEAIVVGVVEDVRYVAMTATTLPEMYFSYRQFSGGLPVTVATLLVRSDDTPTALASVVRSVVRQADDGLVAEAVMTLEDRLLTTSLARPRLYAILLGSFAVVAILVTGVGLFAVLSFTVSQRTRELGVRAALGASRGELVRLVVWQGIGVALGGLAAGLLASVSLARYLASLLYEIKPADGATYIAVPVILIAVAAISCFAPARRASRLDPLRALRS